MADTIKESTELLPPEGHQQVGQKVFEILSEIIEYRKKQHLTENWVRFYDLGRNRHWKVKKVKGVALVSANLLHRHRTRTVNMLTDNNPSFEVSRLGLPENYSDDDYQTILRTCDDWWRNTEQQHLLDRSITNGETFGTTIEKVVFNDQINHGIGEVDPQLLDPFYFGVYPTKSIDNQKAEANLHFYPISIREAKRRWPEHSSKIQPDNSLLQELGDTRQEAISGTKGTKNLLVKIGSAVKELLNSAGGSDSESDMTLVVECWCRDYTKKDGNPLYPGNIRRVTALNCGGLVVDDRGNPSMNPAMIAEDIERAIECYLWERFPFNVAQSGTDTASMYGMSDFEQLEGLQMELNKSLSQFNLSKDRSARTKLINPSNSGVKNEDLTNYPSVINPVNEVVANAIRYMDPPQDYGDLLKAIQFYREFFLEVAGTFDMEQANRSGSDVIAYKAIAALIEQATVMARNKVRSYQKLVRERGRMYLSLAQNWYTEERFISYQESGEDMAAPVTGKKLMIPARLTVVSGSMLPVSRIQQREEALALHKEGVIDNEELLKKIEWPQWKKVLKRMMIGPVANAMETLKAVGVPNGLVEYFQEIVNADPKDLEKAIKEGEVPQFDEVLQAAIGEEPQEKPNLNAEKEQAELAESIAKSEKAEAEAELIREKIKTEKIEQDRIRAGIRFDDQKIKTEKAKVVAEIRGKAPSKSTKNQGPYSERGAKSNNKEA